MSYTKETARTVLRSMLYRHVVAVRRGTSGAGTVKFFDLYAVKKSVTGAEVLIWISGLIAISQIEALPVGRLSCSDDAMVRLAGVGYSASDALAEALTAFAYPDGEGSILVQVI